MGLGENRQQETGGECTVRRPEFFCSLNVIEVIKLWMGWACGTYRGPVKRISKFDREGRKEGKEKL